MNANPSIGDAKCPPVSDRRNVGWKPSGWIIHPLVVAVLPVLFLYSRNIADITVAQLPVPLLVLLGLAITFWCLGRLAFRSWSKGALAASVTMAMLMFYRHAWEVVSGFLKAPLPNARFMPIWCGVYLLAIVVIWRMRRSTESANRAANVFVLILLVIQFGTLAYHRWQWFTAVPGPSLQEVSLEHEGHTWTIPPTDELPDIYYIVLDAYGRDDCWQEVYGYDNRPFLDELRRRGFFVARQSTSNYSKTDASLNTSLHMDYYYQPLERSGAFDLTRNDVVRQLKQIGYKYVLVPSGWRTTSSSPWADVTLDDGVALRGELPALLIEWSAVWFLFDNDRFGKAIKAGVLTDPLGVKAWHDHIQRSIEIIGESASSIEGPKFTFAHVLCPHVPVVFCQDGAPNLDAKLTDFSEVNPGNPWDDPKLVGQLDYLNQMLLAMIDRIQRDSKRPTVIILQGDHGTHRLRNDEWVDHPTDESIEERMGILLACQASPKVKAQLYDKMSPVNLFRAIFRGLFAAHCDFLPDRCYWSFSEDLPDVTDRALSPR